LPDDVQNVDWDALVAQEGPSVWRAVRRVVGNDADAEDVFQETFLDAVDLARREPVRQWRGLLLRLASARAIDLLRSRYRRSKRETDAPGAGDDDGDAMDAFESASSIAPLDAAVAGELSQRLRVALAHIPAKQAEVFCLFCLDGWTYQEIAGHLSMSIDAVGVNVHRARARLRALMGEPQPAQAKEEK
jgi:RNA polymerase sigma-70 factor (ECF subfamily)